MDWRYSVGGAPFPQLLPGSSRLLRHLLEPRLILPTPSCLCSEAPYLVQSSFSMLLTCSSCLLSGTSTMILGLGTSPHWIPVKLDHLHPASVRTSRGAIVHHRLRDSSCLRCRLRCSPFLESTIFRKVVDRKRALAAIEVFWPGTTRLESRPCCPAISPRAY